MKPPAQREAPGAVAAADRAHEEEHQRAGILDDVGQAGKRFATLQARAALAGFKLHRAAGGVFVASRWGRVRELADEAAVDAFLRLVGAPT